MERRYAIWDVFTAKPLGGKPACRRSRCRRPDAARRCRPSRASSIFPKPYSCCRRAFPAHTAYIRIFTPFTELQFAGHPTVGAAIQLADDRISGAAADCDALIVLEEGIGSVRVGVVGRRGQAPYAEFDVPKLPELSGAPAHDDRIAAALGLAPQEIGFANHRPSQYDAGMPFAFVPVRDLDAIARAQIVAAHWEEAFRGASGKVFLYCRETIQHSASLPCPHVRAGRGRAGGPRHRIGGRGFFGGAAPLRSAARRHVGIHHRAGDRDGPARARSSLRSRWPAGELKRVRIGGFACLVARGKLFV